MATVARSHNQSGLACVQRAALELAGMHHLALEVGEAGKLGAVRYAAAYAACHNDVAAPLLHDRTIGKPQVYRPFAIGIGIGRATHLS